MKQVKIQNYGYCWKKVTLEAARNEIPAYYHWDFNSDYFCILVPPSFEITQKSF